MIWQRSVLLALFCAGCAAGQVSASGQHGIENLHAADCIADNQLQYVCSTERPEDLVVIPGTRWIVASGFAPGGSLKLVNAHNRRVMRWYHGTSDQLAPLPGLFPECANPPDPARFHTRGLSLRPQLNGGWRLYVVNHADRESIEVFDISLAEPIPQLRWRGCLLLPPGQVGNSVAAFADGTVLVTVLTRPGTTIADFMLGRPTGAVWQRRPGEAEFTLLQGTELPGNNGIETDPDQRRFYVVAFGLHAVAVFDRADTSRPLALVPAPDFMPDNIRWSDGRLLLAGMRLDEPACGGLRRIVDGVADPMLCHRGWVVGELDTTRMRIRTVAYGTPRPAFNGLSVAVIHDNVLWLGSYQADRIAFLPLAVDGE